MYVNTQWKKSQTIKQGTFLYLSLPLIGTLKVHPIILGGAKTTYSQVAKRIVQ
jgi:hypothetical protein